MPDSDRTRHEKALKLVATWLTHCHHLSGDAFSLRCGSGVCAEYGLEKLLDMYNNDITDADVRQKAGLLMEICRSNLSGTLGYEAASLQGLREILELGMKTFSKADTLDRSGSAEYSVVRKMYYSAWEFLCVVAHGLDQRERRALSKGEEAWLAPEWCHIDDVKGKIRYSMWRATEIWKAEREHREPVAPPVSNDGAAFEAWLLSQEDDTNKDTCRHCRDFIEGQKVLYSESGRSYTKTPGTIMRVDWNGSQEIVECVVQLDDGHNTVVKKVRNEFLSPLINVDDTVWIEGGSAKGKVEDVNDSVWPPTYLVMTSKKSLEEVEDDDIYFAEIDTNNDNAKKEIVEEDGTRVPVPASDSSTDSLDDQRLTSPQRASSIEEGNPPFSYEAHTQQEYSAPSSESDGEDVEEFPSRAGPQRMEPKPLYPVQSLDTHKHTPDPPKYQDDIESMCKGEKLCKSALSAISFGDAHTAVKYLQQAIETLQIQNK